MGRGKKVDIGAVNDANPYMEKVHRRGICNKMLIRYRERYAKFQPFAAPSDQWRAHREWGREWILTIQRMKRYDKEAARRGG